MASIEIAGQQWTLGESLGSGGFGQVYAATSGNHEAAIKLVAKSLGASQEIPMATHLRGMANVIPIYNVDETPDHWVLLMPKAQTKLETIIQNRAVPESQVIDILLDLVTALISLKEKEVIHRDIKPANVLFLDGVWCLADFGISNFVSSAMLTDTLAFSTTRAYMAPEQWREEEVGYKTDIYALGAVAYELLTSQKAFPGPDFRRQHLHEPVPTIDEANRRLVALVEACLSKRIEARPSIEQVQARLTETPRSFPASGRGAASLEQASVLAGRLQSNEHALALQKRSRSERDSGLLHEAERQFSEISIRLKNEILSLAPDSVPDESSSYLSGNSLKHQEKFLRQYNWQIGLGGKWLAFSGTPVESNVPTDFELYGKSAERDSSKLPFGALAWGYVAVGQIQEDENNDYSLYLGRAHSLWFCSALDSKEYGWYEIGFAPRIAVGSTYDPFGRPNYFHRGGIDERNYLPVAINADAKPHNILNASIMDEYGIAVDPILVAPETLGSFIDRWTDWFGEAVREQLEKPKISRSALDKSYKRLEADRMKRDTKSPSAIGRFFRTR